MKWGWMLAVVALVLSGCATMETESSVNGDRWTRSVTMAGRSWDEDMFSLEEVFSPQRGAGISFSERVRGDLRSIETRRTLKVGESVRDDGLILDENGEVRYSNVATVRLDGESIVFEELYRLVGEPKPDSEPLPPHSEELLRELVGSGPSDEQLLAFANEFSELLIRETMAPGEPWFMDIVFLPNLAAQRIRMRCGVDSLEIARRWLPAMNERERKEFVDRLLRAESLWRFVGLNEILGSEKLLAEIAANDEEEDGDGSLSGFVPITVTFAPPGKVLETNGAVDPITGKITWSFISGYLELEEVRFWARCERE